MLFFGAMTPNNRLQRTALRAAAEPERYAAGKLGLDISYMV